MRGNFGSAICAAAMILFLAAAQAQALDTPEAMSPKTIFGKTELTSRTPTFCWTPVSGAELYRILITQVGELVNPIDVVLPAVSCWTLSQDIALTPTNTYIWNVQAFNQADGWSLLSDSAAFEVGQWNSVTIGPSAFVGYTTEDQARLEWGGGALAPLQDRQNEFIAPLNLPDGARIIRIIFYYYNNSGMVSGSEFYLHRSQAISISRETIASLTDLFTYPGEISANTWEISDPVIQNVGYSYFVRVVLPSKDNWITGVQIIYNGG